jgi:MFS family permease
MSDPAPEPAADPPPRWRERVAWYAGTALLSCALVAGGLRLDRADLAAPFYYDLDALLMLPFVKATVERGFGGHWRNEQMGAPGALELHDFPVIDHLHFLLIWLLGQAVPNLLVLYNLYFLLTFPLTVLTAMVVFRRLGLSFPAAATGGLLYAFLPYHYQRWENHYFLAAYWMVPLSLLPAFAILQGDLPFFGRRLRDRRTLGLVLLTAAVASAGAYYAFFACALTAFAGVYAAVARREWRAAAAAGGVVALVVGFGVANHVPTYLYQWENGANPITQRLPEEADLYGLKVAHLLLPIEDHNLPALNRLKWLYNSPHRPAETENRSASLGLVGAAGLVGLVAVAVLPLGRGWPWGPLAGLAVFTVLLATIGGFGSLFNLLVTAQVRGYNRVSVFVGFFGILAAVWALDRVWARHPGGLPARYAAGFGVVVLALFTAGVVLLDVGGKAVWLAVLAVGWAALLGVPTWFRRRHPERFRAWVERADARRLPPRARYAAWAAVAALGFLDQTPRGWFGDGVVGAIDEHAERFRADARFFARVADRLPPGSKVFCLPYAAFPEVPEVYRMRAYEHARGYFHTAGLVWSYGAMKEREADAWQREVGSEPPDQLLRRVTAAGFDGILVDKRGCPPARDGNRGDIWLGTAHSVFEGLRRERTGQKAARLPEEVHEDGQQVFLDLRPYREEWRLADPGGYAGAAAREREYVAATWLGKFLTPMTAVGEFERFRYGPPDGYLVLTNPTDRVRAFQLEMTFGVDQPGAFRFTLSGLAADEFDVEKGAADWVPEAFGVPKAYRVEVPPGRHRVRIRCAPPPDFVPTDVRKLCYHVLNFRHTEVGR